MRTTEWSSRSKVCPAISAHHPLIKQRERTAHSRWAANGEALVSPMCSLLFNLQSSTCSLFSCRVSWWWCYPTPPWKNSRRPNSRATPHGLDQRSEMEEVVPKMTRQRGSDAGQSRRRWVRSCRGCPQALQEELSFRFIRSLCVAPRNHEVYTFLKCRFSFELFSFCSRFIALKYVFNLVLEGFCTWIR